MDFLIEDASWNDDTPKFEAALKELGCKYQLIKYIDLYRDEYLKTDRHNTIFFGSLAVARKLQQSKGCVPGPLAYFEGLKCSKYYCTFGKFLWNKQYIMLPLDEVKRRCDELLESFGGGFFIRPDDGFKTFTGQTINKHDKNDFWAMIEGYRIRGDTLCVLSTVKIPHKEYRLFVSYNQVITGSLYKIDGIITEDSLVPTTVLQYALFILRSVSEKLPGSYFVMDVAVGHDREIGLIELNSYSCSGVYAADVKKIIEAVQDLVLVPTMTYENTIHITFP